MWRSRWTCVLILSLLVGSGGTAGAVAVNEKTPKQVFEERYGPQHRRTVATRTTEDDLALAVELIAAAKGVTDNASLLAEFCESAFILAMRDPSGYDAADEAVELIAAHAPERAAAARERLITFLRRGIATTKGAEQAAVARRLVLYMTRLGDSRVAASDFGGAAKLYQQAIKAADDAKITDIEPLKAKFDAAAGREKVELRIEAANVKLATDPANAMANAELMQVYLIELDNLEQAQRYAKHGGNETAKKLLPLAAGPMDALTAPQALEIGEWFEAMIADAPAHAKLALIARARSFYDQFLLMPSTEKLLQVKVSLAVSRLRDAFAKANPEAAKSVAPVDPQGWVDLLAAVEPVRYRLAGKWRKSDLGLFVKAAEGQNARLTLPAAPRDSYELSVNFTRTLGEGSVSVVLPVGDRSARLLLGGFGGKAGGLYSLTAETVEPDTGIRRNATTVASALAHDTQYTLTIRTLLKDKSATITVDLNGERFLEWTGPRSDLQVDSSWSLHEPAAIGLGATGAEVLFHSAKLKSLRGDAMMIPKPTTLSERGVVTPADGWIDALEIWDPAKDSYDGDWARELDAAVVDRINKRSQQPRTRVPVNPEGDYTLRTRFTCTDNRRGGGPAIYLPLKDTGVVLTLGAGQGNNLAGLSNVDGKDAAGNDSTVKCPVFEVGKSHTMETRVRIKDDHAHIEADLDGEKLLRWSGPRASLALPATWTFGSGKSPAIAMHSAEFSYESVEFRADSEQAPLVRQPPRKLVVDTTPIDLLKRIDVRKHADSGTWSIDSGKLTGTAFGQRAPGRYDYATLALPAAPKGNYELKVKLARSGGRPIINLYLPFAGTGVVLEIGANDGKTSSLSVPSAYIKPGDGNVIGSGDVRFINNSVYSIHAKVQTVGEDAIISVELDGKPYLNWKGSPSILRGGSNILPATFNTSALGIVIANPVVRSSATFAEIELKMTSGTPGLSN